MACSGLQVSFSLSKDKRSMTIAPLSLWQYGEQVGVDEESAALV